jgi:hypothetical protein
MQIFSLLSKLKFSNWKISSNLSPSHKMQNLYPKMITMCQGVWNLSHQVQSLNQKNTWMCLRSILLLFSWPKIILATYDATCDNFTTICMEKFLKPYTILIIEYACTCAYVVFINIKQQILNRLRYNYMRVHITWPKDMNVHMWFL